MRRVVWGLGVLAVLAVAASITVAATVSPAPARQWLRAYGVEVAVPGKGWRLEPASRAVGYDADAIVRAPAVLDAGFCPSSGSSSRAFVGLLPPVAGTPPAAAARAAAIWASGIAGRALHIGGEQRSARVDLDVPVPPGPCSPTTAHLTTVGRSTAAGVVVLILVRDAGEPGDLTPAATERIVGSLRAVGADEG
jgi:hypothetical protein